MGKRQVHRKSGWMPPRLHHRCPISIIPQVYVGCPYCQDPPNLSWLGTGTKYAALHTWRLVIYKCAIKVHCTILYRDQVLFSPLTKGLELQIRPTSTNLASHS